MKPLTQEEKKVIVDKGTKRPFSGKYYDHNEPGVYRCRQCGEPLYRSADKFDSGCGWPSFDDEIEGAVRRVPDADGRRTEIVCAKCGGHLGHVFAGEGFTPRMSAIASTPFRSISRGRPAKSAPRHTAVFARLLLGRRTFGATGSGVLSVESGYTGGRTEHPTYERVCSHETGHAEAVRVVFDPSKTSYEALTKLFLEIHDPTQVDRQGPDIGDQYRSEIFYRTPEQKAVAERLLDTLRAKGYRIATRVTPAGTFWPAEAYHQDYYERKGTQPLSRLYEAFLTGILPFAPIRTFLSGPFPFRVVPGKAGMSRRIHPSARPERRAPRVRWHFFCAGIAEKYV
ncbi:MAG: bifunctional methionine sulfoxide reductase B/A protein [Alistipes ihumii]